MNKSSFCGWTEEQIVDFAMRRSHPEDHLQLDRLRFEKHLNECPHCRQSYHFWTECLQEETGSMSSKPSRKLDIKLKFSVFAKALLRKAGRYADSGVRTLRPAVLTGAALFAVFALITYGVFDAIRIGPQHAPQRDLAVYWHPESAPVRNHEAGVNSGKIMQEKNAAVVSYKMAASDKVRTDLCQNIVVRNDKIAIRGIKQCRLGNP